MLKYLCQQFVYLEMMNILSDDLEQHDFVVNRVIDIRFVAMMYLAITIHHDAMSLETPGATFIYICSNVIRQNCEDLFPWKYKYH